MIFRERYPLGTQVQSKQGYVKVKTREGWVGRNRYNWALAHGDLSKNQKVYHINGDKADDKPHNLVAISFNTTKYALKHSRVLWIPSQKRKAA